MIIKQKQMEKFFEQDICSGGEWGGVYFFSLVVHLVFVSFESFFFI